MDTNNAVDHIVYGVLDLESGIRYFEKRFGMSPVFGGYHKTQGTKNALVNLSNGCYLELIAIDPDNHDIKQDRWMGIDHLETPKMIRWAIKSSNLLHDQKILQAYDPAMGNIQSGSRQTTTGELLEWELIMPLSAPEVEVIPFVLDWSQSTAHPTQSLQPSGFELTKIQLTHPRPDEITDVLQALHTEAEVMRGKTAKINAVLQGPEGVYVI